MKVCVTTPATLKTLSCHHLHWSLGRHLEEIYFKYPWSWFLLQFQINKKRPKRVFLEGIECGRGEGGSPNLVRMTPVGLLLADEHTGFSYVSEIRPPAPR